MRIVKNYRLYKSINLNIVVEIYLSSIDFINVILTDYKTKAIEKCDISNFKNKY